MALRSDNCDRLINCATSKRKQKIKLHLSPNDLKLISIYYGRTKISSLMSFLHHFKFASRLVTINEQNDPTRSCPGAHTRRHSLGARSPFAHPYFLFCPQRAHIRGLGQRRQMQLFLLVIFLTECALFLQRFPFVLSRGACLPLPRCPIPFSRWSCICNMLDAPGNPRICPLLVTVL